MALLVNTQIRNDLYATGSITAGGGFTGSFSGSFIGTSSFALSASSVPSQVSVTGITASGAVYSTAYQVSSNHYNEYLTSYTASNIDDGKFVIINSASAVTVTLPTQSISPSFNSTFFQSGSGAIQFATGDGAVLRHRLNHTGSTFQYSIMTLIRVTSGDYILRGDTS